MFMKLYVVKLKSWILVWIDLFELIYRLYSSI